MLILPTTWQADVVVMYAILTRFAYLGNHLDITWRADSVVIYVTLVLVAYLGNDFAKQMLLLFL